MGRRAEMDSRDAVLAKEASVNIVVDGRRYKWLTLINFEAKYNLKTKPVPAVGRLVDGRKPTGADVQWSATAYKCESIFQDAVQKYLDTGVFPDIEITCENEDQSSSVGASIAVLNRCIIDGDVKLAQLASNDDFFEQALSGYAESINFPEKFRTPTYML